MEATHSHSRKVRSPTFRRKFIMGRSALIYKLPPEGETTNYGETFSVTVSFSEFGRRNIGQREGDRWEHNSR